MSSPPTKRQRTEDAPITRSDIWYPDGSVVLQVQDTQFRVHWSVLAQNSSFFRDMQALPQPPDQPTIDGCPVVDLPDAVEDVKHLLTTLYDPTVLFQKALPFSVIAALIRLGRKYDFRKLLDAAVELVMAEHPTTLEEYLTNMPYVPKKIIDYHGLEYDMVDLATENDILSALPCAYYRMLRCYTQSQLFDGVPRPDGTLTSLAPIVLRQCSVSREKILSKQIQPSYTLGWLWKWDHDGDCTSLSKCTSQRKVLMQHYLEFVRVRAFETQLESLKGGFCVACFQHIEERVNTARKKTWEELPAFFDLPPWSDLKNDL